MPEGLESDFYRGIIILPSIQAVRQAHKAASFITWPRFDVTAPQAFSEPAGHVEAIRSSRRELLFSDVHCICPLSSFLS
jgi:hypothetical protein